MRACVYIVISVFFFFRQRCYLECWLFRARSATCMHKHIRTHTWLVALTAAIRCVRLCVCALASKCEYLWIRSVENPLYTSSYTFIYINIEYSLTLSRIEKCVFCTFLRHSVIHFELYCGSELMRFLDPFSVRWNWMSLIFSHFITKKKRVMREKRN